MNPTQEVIKAWWFDRLSDLVAQNMALAAEVAQLRGLQGGSGGLQPGNQANGGIDPVAARRAMMEKGVHNG